VNHDLRASISQRQLAGHFKNLMIQRVSSFQLLWWTSIVAIAARQDTSAGFRCLLLDESDRAHVRDAEQAQTTACISFNSVLT